MKSTTRNLEEQTIETSIEFKGRLLELHRDKVRLPDGHESTREYVRHQGAVMIIPVLPNGELIFERQYRYPLQQVVIELPAGKIDPGEQGLETAKRELSEETGYTASDWRHLGFTYPCVGYSNERIEIFMAQGLEKAGDQHLDHGEFVELFSLSIEEALDALRAGEITDSKTMTALFWAEKVLKDGW